MSFLIKNNTVILDKRLDCLLLGDKRDNNFPVTSWLNFTEPRDIAYYCDKHLDQGQEGACVGFGTSHLIATLFSGLVYVDEKFARETIYWPAQKIDPWDGGAYPDADPFYEGTATNCGLKIAKQLGFFTAFRRAFTLKDVILGLSWHGPALFGVNWYEYMGEPDRKGFIHVKGKQTGGHCILGKALSLDKKGIKLHNSWGEDWGVDKGCCWISLDDVDKLLKQGGEIYFALGKHKVLING